MNLSEFKAWFEGFTEGMDGPPNEAQWKRIQERLASVAASVPIADSGRGVFPVPAFDPRRQILGQSLTGVQCVFPNGHNNATLNAAGPTGNGVGAMAFAARPPPHGRQRLQDV